MIETALQIAERREVKGKGRKMHPIECRVPEKSKKDKKDFLNEQCKVIEENKRMRKTRNVMVISDFWPPNVNEGSPNSDPADAATP